MFEAFVNENDGSRRKPSRTRRLIFAVSFALHAALLAAAAVHSFWTVDELSPPGVPVTFVHALAPPPPPPPPAAARVAKASEKAPARPRKPRPEPAPIVQPPEEKPAPVEPPDAPAEETAAESEGDPEPGGQAGGVTGGVAGGVLAAVAPPPPPAPPVNIAPHVGAAHRLTDLEDPRYRPSLPPSINRPGMAVWGIYRICVAASGRVSDVTLVKSADALVDQDWMAKIRTWQYRPYSVDGRPVPFCHPARITVKSAS